MFGGRLCVGRLHLLPMATTERICGCTTTSSVIGRPRIAMGGAALDHY